MQNLKEFDTIILDLDYTVWSGNKEHFWAKSLVFPIQKKRNKIYDKNNDFLTLHYGIKTFLDTYKDKNIGFITRGGLLDTGYDNQPCIICLKLFGLLPYFTYKNHILYKTDNKSKFIQKTGKTIFIDDNPIDLTDIKQNHSDITVLDRTTFSSWTTLI